MTKNPPSIIVVGGGIIGASIAWQLTTRGAHVTLIDAGAIGAVATACSFAWTNATAHNPKQYFDLRMRSLQEWDHLAAAIPDLPFRRTGTLYADFDGVDIEAFVANHASWGYDIRLITAEQARQYEPAVKVLNEPIALSECEGAVEATAAASLLATLARKAGAMVYTGIGIDSITVDGQGRVDGVMLNGAPITADEVIVAAGVETPRIVGPLGVELPMKTPPGLLVHTKPTRPLVSRILIAHQVHLRQREDGVIMAGADFGGGIGNDTSEEAAQRVIDVMRKTLIGGEDIELDHTTLGYRPTPGDGFPVVGRPSHIDGLYIATMHSGVTLAPVIGRFVADEILDGRRDELLNPFGVDRFKAN
jgi:glycine/D-amino acid oxidase-like deaminating enzyme